MAKIKTTYVCQNCGSHSPKWIGKCPSCDEWNTYVEEVLESKKTEKLIWKEGDDARRKKAKPLPLDDVVPGNHRRIQIPDQELNRVLGGGIVPGSLILIGGEPGIGKSTLTLQLGLRIKQLKILYVSGEESAGQVRMRADRMGISNPNFYILTETVLEHVFAQIKELEPQLLIVDSIQTLSTQQIDSIPGSVGQIRACAAQLQRYAKEKHVPVMIIGHINKEGYIAGPKILEHMVDTVLQFEGDRHYQYRILRTTKNRFGPTSELGIYEMLGTGLREVSNPSDILMTPREEDLSGISISATMEGARPMLIETQALVSPAVYGTPQRSATGYDTKRLGMILAVLEKKGGFPFGMNDVFLNLAGGIKVTDPALDLAVVAALISSLEDKPIPNNNCFAGEVSLSGEIRAVNRIEQRITEAEKLGFKTIWISSFHKKSSKLKNAKIEIKTIGKLEQLYARLFTQADLFN